MALYYNGYEYNGFYNELWLNHNDGGLYDGFTNDGFQTLLTINRIFNHQMVLNGLTIIFVDCWFLMVIYSGLY